MQTKPLLGTRIFAILLIWASVYKVWGISDYDYYKFMFQYLPEKIIILRYVASISLRLFAIFIAANLLKGKDFYRKIFILICVMSIVLLPWKHPYKVFMNLAILNEKAFGDNLYPDGTTTMASGYPHFPEQLKDYNLKNPSFPRISLIFYNVIDIIFFLSAILYFTRPKVKSYFTKEAKNE